MVLEPDSWLSVLCWKKVPRRTAPHHPGIRIALGSRGAAVDSRPSLLRRLPMPLRPRDDPLLAELGAIGHERSLSRDLSIPTPPSGDPRRSDRMMWRLPSSLYQVEGTPSGCVVGRCSSVPPTRSTDRSIRRRLSTRSTQEFLRLLYLDRSWAKTSSSLVVLVLVEQRLWQVLRLRDRLHRIRLGSGRALGPISPPRRSRALRLVDQPVRLRRDLSAGASSFHRKAVIGRVICPSSWPGAGTSSSGPRSSAALTAPLDVLAAPCRR